MNLLIRRVLTGEAAILSQIAFAAKAYWGYPARWMEIWRPQLTFSSQYFEENESWVAEYEGTPIGFYTLQEKDTKAWLENLWVSPDFIGKGVGEELFLHAVELSRQHGYRILNLEADPNAQGFYVQMGMQKVGERKSEVEGQPRILPIMEMIL